MNEMKEGELAGLFTLLHAAGAAEGHVEAKLAVVGLSLPKLAALSALHEAGDSLPLSQLAERLSCVKSNITQLVDRLEADGFVSRAADPHDRRSRLAVLTTAGRKAHETGIRVRHDAEQGLLSDLSNSERLQLGAMLAKLQRNAG